MKFVEPPGNEDGDRPIDATQRRVVLHRDDGASWQTPLLSAAEATALHAGYFAAIHGPADPRGFPPRLDVADTHGLPWPDAFHRWWIEVV